MGSHEVNNGQAALPTLPVELLLDIFAHLPASDISNILATCRALHTHTACESIWQELASRLGVRDISNVPSRFCSFRVVYIHLLHAHRSLFGYWVSDALFWNDVLHVRWQPGDPVNGVQCAIVGSLLDMAVKRVRVNPVTDDAVPQPPIYSLMFSISLVDDAPEAQDKPGAPPQQPLSSTYMSCYFTPEHHATSIVLGRRRKLLLKTVADAPRREITPFPEPDAPWLRRNEHFDTRTFPLDTRLAGDRSIASATVPDRDYGMNQPGEHHSRHWHHRVLTAGSGIFVYSEDRGPTDNIGTAAFSLSCRCYDTYACPEIPHHLNSTRWFPLLPPIPAARTSVAPDATSIAKLSGLWIGAIPTVNSQMVFLHEGDGVGGKGHLQATKVTGDKWLARGGMSWDANLRKPIELESLPKDIGYEFQRVLGSYASEEALPPITVVYSGVAKTGLNWNMHM